VGGALRPDCFFRAALRAPTRPQQNISHVHTKKSCAISFSAFRGAKNFPVKKIFVHISCAPARRIFRGEIDSPKYSFAHPAEFARRVYMSTQKVTENLQNSSALHLTVISTIPIGCGQGSGHPHPVVVDNVLESFGNFVSPRLFPRL
jgi:hypothetical protein